MKRSSILLLFLISFCFSVMAQQSILLVTGKRVYVSETKIDNDLILYKTKKGKIRAFAIEEVFSLTRKDNVEVIFYKPDCEDVCFKINQMRDYLHGLADGREAKMWLPAAGGFITGVAAGRYTNPVFSVLAPALFSGGVALVTPKPENLDIPQKYINNEHYITGFQESTKKKRIITSLIGGGVGIALGITSRKFIPL